MNLHFTLEIVAVFVFIVSFLTSYILLPKLIGIVHYKKLMDNPNERSSHSEKTPTLGGVVFFVSLIFGLFTIHYFDFNGSSMNILVGVTILFVIGLKDDLMVLSAQTKLGAQIVAVSFVLILPDLWITSFSGFLGINEIPLFIGILMSYFIMISIINAYNLIDGIDGLSGLIGILIFSIFGGFFYLTSHSFYFLLSILAIGFLIAFLRFNFSKTRKIFMGDTGSLIVGFLISILCIRFLALGPVDLDEVNIDSSNRFIIALSILFFPIIDVFRVIVMRLLNRRGPFSPDRCHMHHILVDKGLSHRKASVTLLICSSIIFGIIYLVNSYFYWTWLIFVFCLLTIMTYIMLSVLDSDKQASIYRKNLRCCFLGRCKKENLD